MFGLVFSPVGPTSIIVLAYGVGIRVHRPIYIRVGLVVVLASVLAGGGVLQKSMFHFGSGFDVVLVSVRPWPWSWF